MSLKNGVGGERSWNFQNDTEMADCFRFFDRGGKGFLDRDDFHLLEKSLLRDDPDSPQESKVDDRAASCFGIDGEVDERKFERIWKRVIGPMRRPVSALLVIDVQNDFIDGSLAMRNCPAEQDGLEIVPVINDLIRNVKFDSVVYSLDFHPEDHISFFENATRHELVDGNASNVKLFDTVVFGEPVRMEQKLWPVHCVQGTKGCDLHPDLQMVDDPLMIRKGTNPKVDSYSAFFDNLRLSSTGLHDELQKRGVTHVFVCGLAFDFCVAYTALDAAELGYATVVVQDATKGTDHTTITKARQKLLANSVVMASSEQVKNISSGKDIWQQFVKAFIKNLN